MIIWICPVKIGHEPSIQFETILRHFISVTWPKSMDFCSLTSWTRINGSAGRAYGQKSFLDPSDNFVVAGDATIILSIIKRNKKLVDGSRNVKCLIPYGVDITDHRTKFLNTFSAEFFHSVWIKASVYSGATQQGLNLLLLSNA